ncbi:MAG: Rieske 2Fe-2S domain-containing protein [Pseudomonadota bacterium]
MNAPFNRDIIQTGDELERCPFPIPYGWYNISFSHELKAGEIKIEKVFGKEWVLFRGEDGSVGMTDPYCPHLGAHLGHGGKVVGDNIQCPFHHWEFNSEGWCKNIPYGKVMPGIAKRKPILKALPVVEKYNVIWAWYHPQDVEPMWDIPVVPEMEDPENHVEPRYHMWDIGTCIQEMGENSVDTPHLKFLHGAPIIPSVDAKAEGHIWHYDIMDGYIVGESHGPGIPLNRHSKDGVSMLMFAMPTPTDAEMSRVRMMFTWKKYDEGSKEAAIAEHLYQHSIGEAEGEDSAGFESVDLIVWDNKKYRPKPLLCDGDGPIIAWRKYFRQFYVDLDETNAAVAM